MGRGKHKKAPMVAMGINLSPLQMNQVEVLAFAWRRSLGWVIRELVDSSLVHYEYEIAQLRIRYPELALPPELAKLLPPETDKSRRIYFPAREGQWDGVRVVGEEDRPLTPSELLYKKIAEAPTNPPPVTGEDEANTHPSLGAPSAALGEDSHKDAQPTTNDQKGQSESKS